MKINRCCPYLCYNLQHNNKDGDNMTDSEKLDLILSEMQSMKRDIDEIKQSVTKTDLSLIGYAEDSEALKLCGEITLAGCLGGRLCCI